MTATHAGPAASISARQCASTAAAASQPAVAAARAAVERGGALDVGERHHEPRARLGLRLDRVGPELRRVRVDAEHDLGLARRDGGGEAVAERGVAGDALAGVRQSVARRRAT